MAEIMSESKMKARDVGVLVINKQTETTLAKLCTQTGIVAFKNIRMYGTTEEPFYAAQDIYSALGIGMPRLTGAKSDYKPEIHVQTILTPTIGGVQTIVAFTEEGLIKALISSRSEIGQKILTYITVVIKQLMRDGIATINKVSGEYKTKLEEQHQIVARQKREFDALDAAASKVYDENLQLKDNEVADKNRIHQLCYNNKKLLQEHDINNKTIVQFLIRQHAIPVHIILLSAPKQEVADEFSYDLMDEIVADNSDYVFTFKTARKTTAIKSTVAPEPVSILSHDDQMAKNLLDNPLPVPGESKTERKTEKKPPVKTKRSAGIVYIHPGETIDVLFKMMDKQDVNLRHSDEKVGIHEHKYVSPLANIKMDANDRYLKVLAKRNKQAGYELLEYLGIEDDTDNNDYFRNID